ncbi:MAG TPA: YbhB/YbcL family Raf kinase inhibitor-like protein [Candidatus Limnocylindria bacterium]|nr:YbhB/YbcL family Raf kinase inhibitor-like protein [Candidatus Limnocylindria bacterium]
MTRGRAPVLLLVPLAAALARPGGAVMAFELKSRAFKPGETIPRKHTCDGEDVSPPLAWTDPPAGTKSFALVCDDPDAPAGTWVHWVLYGVPASARSLPEGVPPKATHDDGSRQGTNDFRRTGYGGPCPPRGAPHRYYFRLYALDAVPELAPGATKAALLKAIGEHTLGQAELMGRYGRQ